MNLLLIVPVYKPPAPGAPVPPGHEHRVPCNYGKTPLPPGKSCEVDIEKFGPCVSSNHYKYDVGQPCIFLKLNKVK